VTSLGDVEIIVGGGSAAVVSLPSGESVPLRGIPSTASVTQLVRVRDATLLYAYAGTPYDPERPSAVFLVRDGSATAKRLPGVGIELKPAASRDSYWLVVAANGRYLAEERDLSGRLLRRVPRGWVFVRGVSGGVLLSTGESLLVWDPDRSRPVRSIRGVKEIVATTNTFVAWIPDDSCQPQRHACSLHVTDLRDGSDVVAMLPTHSGPVAGEFSPDRSALALVLSSPDETYFALHRLTLATGVTRRLPGMVPGLHLTLGLSWSADDGVLISAVTDSGPRFAGLVDGRLQLLPEFAEAGGFVLRPAH
jgi:hypothetical protein